MVDSPQFAAQDDMPYALFAAIKDQCPRVSQLPSAAGNAMQQGELASIRSRLLKKSSQPASPSVVSPASGRELKEGSQLLRTVLKPTFP
jgi:hypothetical protein